MGTKKKKKIEWINILAPFVVLAIIVVILEILAKSGKVAEYVLPAPSKVVAGTIKSFGKAILPDFLFSIKIILIGFISATILGLLLAAIFSQFSIVAKATSPVIIWLVITPMITLVPLVLLWLGNDPNVRVIIVILQASPIICLNTLTGLTTIETEKKELARSVGATRFQAFIKINFMNAMPQVFTGIKLGCIFSIIGSISADFVAKTIGMGNKIIQFTKYVQTDLAYGSILLVALLGIGMYMLIEAIEKKVVIWRK
jgi:ABC-type nitrate/sulfonate/bicarbonate transport system permease component